MFFPYLYFGLLALAAITHLGAWLAAVRRDDLPRWARWGHGAVLLLLFPAAVIEIEATDPLTSGMLPFAWLLGVLFLASAALALRTAGPAWGARLCAGGIALFCTLFGAVHLLRYTAYLGIRLPILLEGLVVAHAATMGAASIFLYIFFPVLPLWPLARIASRQPRVITRLLNGVAFLIAVALVVSTLRTTPHGMSIARQWQARAQTRVEPDPDFRCGVVIRIHQGAFPDSQRLAAEREAVRELEARAVNLFIHPAIMEEPQELVDAVAAFAGELQAEGRTVILTADYPGSAWMRRRPDTVAEVETAMVPFHRFLLERVPCDIFVPYIEPYGAFVALTGMRIEADAWVRLLSSATTETHRLDPEVRTAVYLGQGDDDEVLYHRLLAAPGTVDVLGISIYAVYEGTHSIDQKLDRVSQWLAAGGADYEHWLFEFGQSPLTMGGERAQAGFILHVLDWAAREPAFHGGCVFALADYAERMGLVASNGRRRYAWGVLQELAARCPGNEGAAGAQ